jgi:hypothetical protein
MTARHTLFPGLLAATLFASAGRGDEPVPVPASITVSPTALDLRHSRRPHALQILAMTADGYTLDLRPQARLTSADPRVAIIDAQGWVRPVGNGQTQVTVAVAGQSRSVAVKVQLPAAEPPYSFRHEVMPVLSRAGCNMGACHGYSLGKNGFKLSLRGSDPEPDFFAITRDSFGRRIAATSPGDSLLLAKPRGDAPHEGGVRFARNSLSDEILTRWIAQGAPGDLEDKARVAAVRLVPDKLVLRPGQQHRLQLLATYNDGTTRDVTRLGIFTVNNDRFAAADGAGLVTAGDAGETAVVARFERTFAATSVLVLNPNPSFVPTPLSKDNLIDRHVIEKLNRLRITPSPLADDEEFLRRVYLDLIGVQPRPDEVRAFLADRDTQKREKVVDALFGRPEFVDHWSLKWGDLLQNSRNTTSPKSVYLFREFLRGAVAANMPLDELARKLLTARGGPVDDPASVYLASSKDTNDTVERTTQVFCGVRLLCARCHAHPLENWTQADYYGLASFFSQVSARPDARFPNAGNTRRLRLNPDAGAAVNPRSRQPQPPRFLGGVEPKLPAGGDRREAYARWLTSPQNPYFARGLVNRFWSYFFHRGIVEPVDDVRSTNPPVNPALLDALTQDFIEHKFDVRYLMRRIVSSATYQRSSAPTPSNRHDELNFSHAVPRRVPAEALLDSLVQATGVAENVGNAPGGFRAAQLPDGDVDSPFLRLFGKPQRMDACECERDNDSNMLQALHFINGKSILNRVQNPAGRPALLLRQKLPDAELITELYLWSLARRPRNAELKLGLAFFRSYGDRQALGPAQLVAAALAAGAAAPVEGPMAPLMKTLIPARVAGADSSAARAEAAQDLMWALLNSRDFLLSH